MPTAQNRRLSVVLTRTTSAISSSLTTVQSCYMRVNRQARWPSLCEQRGSEGYASTCCHDDGCPGIRGRRHSNSKHDSITEGTPRASKTRSAAWRNQRVLLRLCNVQDAIPFAALSHREVQQSRFRCCTLVALRSREGVRFQSRRCEFFFRRIWVVPVLRTSAILTLDAHA